MKLNDTPASLASVVNPSRMSCFALQNSASDEKSSRSFSSVGSQVDIDLLNPNRSSSNELRSGSQISSLTDVSHIDITDYSSVNLTTARLRSCKQNILIPYLRLLKFVGWRPFADDRYYRGWMYTVLNWIYPIVITLLLLYTYVYEIVSCQWKLNIRQDTKIIPLYSILTHKENLTSSTSGVDGLSLFETSNPWLGSAITVAQKDFLPTAPPFTPQICDHIISTYIIPNTLHLIAFIMGIGHFRFRGDEEVYALLEKVFLELEPLHYRNVSDYAMVRNVRIFLVGGMIWVLFTLALQGLYVWAYNFPSLMIVSQTGITTQWLLLVLQLFGILIMNSVNLAVICNYVIQCEAIILFVKSFSLRMMESSLDLRKGMRNIVDIKHNLNTLNGHVARMTSLVTLILLDLTILGFCILILNTYNIPKIWIYRSLFPIIWSVMVCAPLVQAARVNSVCKHFKNDALVFAAHGYKTLPQEELDSYVLFTGTVRLEAKLFHISVMPSYLIGLMFFVGFIMLILFQNNVIATTTHLF